MKIRQYFEYWILQIIVFSVKVLPLSVSLGLARILADFVFFVPKIRVKVTQDNLKIAFGNNKSEKELKALARKVYRNFLMMAIESLRIPRLSDAEIKKNVTMVGLEHIENALKKGKGMIFVACHYGNWELMGTAIKANGYPITYIDGEQKNKLVEDFMSKLRLDSGIKLIERKNALRGVIKTVRSNEILALLSDQNAGPDGVFVDFFGKLASTPQGAAAFSIRIGAPIVLGYNVPDEGRMHNTVHFTPIAPKLTGDEKKDIFIITQEFTKKFEEFIKEKPEHYFWLHRRWKASP
ncbi:MAG: lysophospholipid acyltransferase family protein [Elusimicrobia bacterium]|nr:lysophospholipid acyltransferase family protein [Elusimicrobiota bacterium]MBU2615307.1 lysophospholipid acyltransferase family protein [Elusimicrobiota bacterium]